MRPLDKRLSLKVKPTVIVCETLVIIPSTYQKTAVRTVYTAWTVDSLGNFPSNYLWADSQHRDHSQNWSVQPCVAAQ